MCEVEIRRKVNGKLGQFSEYSLGLIGNCINTKGSFIFIYFIVNMIFI